MTVRRSGRTDEWLPAARQVFEAARGGGRIPFLHPVWLASYATVTGARAEVWTAYWDGTPVAVAPLSREGRLVPSRRNIAGEHSDLGGWLVDPSHPSGLDDLVAAVLASHQRNGAVLALGRVRHDDPLRDSLDRALREHPGLVLSTVRTDSFPVLDLTGEADPEAAVARLARKNDVPRRRRRLEQGREVEFRYDEAGDSSAVPDFLRLHARRWERKGGQPSGAFTSSSGARFLVDVARRSAAEDGPVRVSFLYVDGKRVGGRFGFELDGRYYGLKSAFDPDLSSSGPGHLMVAMLLAELVPRGVLVLDFMRGVEPHKLAWANRTVDVPYLAVHRAGARGAVEGVAHRARSSLRHRFPDGLTPRPLRRSTTG